MLIITLIVLAYACIAESLIMLKIMPALFANP